MEIYFDLDKIVKIKFLEKREDESLQWVDPKPIKKFFGLYNTGRFTDGYFTDVNIPSILSSYYTEEYLRTYGSLVEGKKVYKKPWVKVELEHVDPVTRYFENDEEARNWINKLSRQSKKNFEIVKY